MSGYFRPAIEAMQGYAPGEQPQGGPIVKLNTNESQYPPSPRVKEAIARFESDRLRLYPDPLARRFREAAGKLCGVPSDWIVPVNGSDEALTLLTRACLDKDDLMVAPTPSYLLYRVLAAIQGCRFAERSYLKSGDLPDDFLAGAKLGFVPNPNSPTGHVISADRLLALAESAAGLLVVDEAYADFAESNCLASVARCERLVVCRTLSKSYALAGLRFGYVVAQPQVAETLRKIKDSYNTDAVSIAAATAAIEDADYLRITFARIKATRTRMERELAGLGFAVTPSQANFVWCRREASVRPIYESLKERGILVRHLRYDGYGEGIRISI
ncbi:MAG TPA: histidinol-phosphate transaminase, partial [Planctomycetia bacterium]|nr:histidinol-phosphate transaminase [Planctomycetia bacterium]